MGADRYTTCPRCVHEYDEAVGRVVEAIAISYPDLSATARDALRPVLIAERNLTPPERTFREDYEFAHNDADPDVRVIYEGRCSVCDLALMVDETHTIWTRP